jgi:hypothetical protein
MLSLIVLFRILFFLLGQYMPNWREDLPMIIVDIDGTIADSSKRLQDIGFDPKKPREEWPQKPSDWGDHMTDRPIFPMIHIVNDLYESNFIWIVTIRHPIPDTIRWLETHGVCHDRLVELGSEDNSLQPAEYKETWLHSLPDEFRGRIVCAFEDSPSMIKMFRENGILCLDVGQCAGSM